LSPEEEEEDRPPLSPSFLPGCASNAFVVDFVAPQADLGRAHDHSSVSRAGEMDADSLVAGKGFAALRLHRLPSPLLRPFRERELERRLWLSLQSKVGKPFKVGPPVWSRRRRKKREKTSCHFDN